MESFQVDSVGLTRGEFTQAIHRLSRRFLLGVVVLGVVVYLLLIGLMGYHSLYILFPGSIVVAILLFFEMKGQANYGKFDYEGVVFHFRFEPERWVVLRNNELNTRAEYTWAETLNLWETKSTLLLVPSKGVGSYTLPKRSLTSEQMECIKGWFGQSRKKS